MKLRNDITPAGHRRSFGPDPFMPVPVCVPSNGEFDPPPQTESQKRVAEVTLELADIHGKPHGLDRRGFLKTAAGMATALMAMNMVHGHIFSVNEAEAADPDFAESLKSELEDQFIFDSQLHFVHDEFDFQGLLNLRKYAADHWNPDIRGEAGSFETLRFENFIKEVFLQSQTKIGLLSGAPSDVKENWFLSNDEIVRARDIINSIAGSKRMYGHFVITPGQPGWIDAIDRGIEQLKPDSWKGYTIGDPLSDSRYPWRLDDEKLMYPVYEKMVKAGITNVCIHKGLLPNDYLDTVDAWKHATVDDVPKAAKDWPQLTFIIYHAALKPLNNYSENHLKKFEETGRIDWVSDLAEIPKKHGVTNVHAEIGTAFGSAAVTHPRHAAAMVGILIKGMGLDHVHWGTDSVWYGSPQWQIEAFRRIEIPEDLQKKLNLSPLGGPKSRVKQAILGENAARVHGLDIDRVKQRPYASGDDRLAELKKELSALSRHERDRLLQRLHPTDRV